MEIAFYDFDDEQLAAARDDLHKRLINAREILNEYISDEDVAE